MFTNNMNIEASVFLFLQIQLFQLLFAWLLPLLTEFENHRYQANYYNSYLWKQFLFQSVNQFLPFLHMVLNRAALVEVQWRLILYQILLAITAILTIAWSWAKQRFWDAADIGRSFEEAQSKRSEFRITQQIDAMTWPRDL